MKTLLLSLVLTLLYTPCRSEDNGAFPGSVHVWFSPKGGCTLACVNVINKAKKTIYVQAYWFTSAPLAQALVRAKARGVVVEVILDRQNVVNFANADLFTHAGIPTFIDARHVIAHNKVMIIDGTTVVTGSFNFTALAETSNAENLLVIHGQKLADRYFTNWKLHLSHSDPYVAKEVTPAPAPLP